jgi:hypothetical protein
MPGNKVGVEMRQEYIFDYEFVRGGNINVMANVPLRVNDGCRT